MDHIVPLVMYLCHESSESNRNLFSVGGGWMAKLRLERTKGVNFNTPFAVENVRDRFAEILDFTDAEHPEEARETSQAMYENYERNLERKAKL